MKKWIAALLAGMMVCMNVAVFALTPEDFETAVNAKFNSAKAEFVMKAEITDWNAEFFEELFETDFSELPSAEMKYDMVITTAQDMKQIQAKIDMAITTVPEIADETPYHATAYLDFDVSDETAPKYQVIMKAADSEKYQVMDYMQLPGAEEMMAMIANLTAQENVSAWNEVLKASLPELKKEYKANTETVTLNDAQTKKAIVGIVQVMREMFAATGEDGALEALPQDAQSEIQMAAEAIATALKDVKLFAEDGVVVTTTLDAVTKQLQSIDCMVKIDTNLTEAATELLKGFGVDMNVSEILPKEKADFKAQISFNMAYSDWNNETLKVEFPMLTAENTEYLTDDAVDENAVNIYYDGKKIDFKDVQPVIENDRTLVPIRHFCNGLGIGDENIQYDDGVVTIQNGDTKLTLKIDAQDVVIEKNGETKTVMLDVPATERKGRTLVPLRFISENFDCDVYYEEFCDAFGNATGCLIQIEPAA